MTVRFLVHGRVQGVGYRAFAKAAAEKRGLTGYARNLDDGTVEVIASGEEDQVLDFFGDLQRGPRWAEVHAVHRQEHPPAKHSSFEIQ